MSASATASKATPGHVAERPRWIPADGLLHPISVLCLLLLVVNDHHWKTAYAGLWTGKLSDIAGLALFPLFLQAALELASKALGRPWGPSRKHLLWASALTAIAFALVQVWPPVTAAYAHGLAWVGWPARAAMSLVTGAAITAPGRVHITADPTDLWTLPAVALALLAGWRRSR